MAILPRDTNASRAIQMLDGIMQGIAADKEITDGEVLGLRDWLNLHKDLHEVCPFADLYSLVGTIEKSRQVEEEVKEEILEFCEWFFADKGPVDYLTTEIRTLHGFLQGISSDGDITLQEATALQSWIKDRSDLLDKWPFSQIYTLLFEVLCDNRISETEHQRILEICQQFAEKPAEKILNDGTLMPDLPFLKTPAPELRTLDFVCNKEILVTVPGKSFCFTGQMKAGTRKEMHALVEIRGGIPKKGVTIDLDYLVVGGNSNPAWIYSTYGRKIERVMSGGGSTAIIHEDGFTQAL